MTEDYFWKTIIETVVEADSLIEAAHNDGLVNHHKIVMLGSSMGGFITSGTFINNSLIDGLIVINGSTAWMISEQEFQKSGSRPYPFIEEIMKYDPMDRIYLLNNRPVLLLHGEVDTIINPIAQQMFYKRVVKDDVDTNNVTFHLVPNVNHTITLSMIERVVEWLHHHVDGTAELLV